MEPVHTQKSPHIITPSDFKRNVCSVNYKILDEKSSLTSRRKSQKSLLHRCFNSFLLFLGKIFNFIGDFLGNYIFCCFRLSGKLDKIDWTETKEVLEDICKILKSDINETERIKKFGKCFALLSKGAIYRFKQHIGFVLAKQKGFRDRVSQELYVNDNFGKIDFRNDYFNKVNSRELKEAAENFKEEAKRK